MTGSLAFAKIEEAGKRRTFAKVNLVLDLLGSSSELPLGFALRAQIQPEVSQYTRAFLCCPPEMSEDTRALLC